MTEHSPMRTQDGVPVGNLYNKAETSNPIARYLVQGFDRALLSLLQAADPASIHEVGCGEGRLSRMIAARYPVSFQASDFSHQLIEENSKAEFPGNIRFVQRSIYELQPQQDSADLVICCEVLEHLEQPGQALQALRALNASNYIFSVPREPLWRILNMSRGKYWRQLGNTPGHLQNWSQRGFRSLLQEQGFAIETLLAPLPWTMVRGSFR